MYFLNSFSDEIHDGMNLELYYQWRNIMNIRYIRTTTFLGQLQFSAWKEYAWNYGITEESYFTNVKAVPMCQIK